VGPQHDQVDCLCFTPARAEEPPLREPPGPSTKGRHRGGRFPFHAIVRGRYKASSRTTVITTAVCAVLENHTPRAPVAHRAQGLRGASEAPRGSHSARPTSRGESRGPRPDRGPDCAEAPTRDRDGNPARGARRVRVPHTGFYHPILPHATFASSVQASCSASDDPHLFRSLRYEIAVNPYLFLEAAVITGRTQLSR